MADHIDLVQVDAANCFHVEVQSHKGNEIHIEAVMEGEYSQNLELGVSTKGATLFVETDFAPNFSKPNDKLSAHKVVSILLKLKMPNYKRLIVFGTNSRVEIEGGYQDLQVVLADGACLLKNVRSNATIKSQSGNIKVISKSARISAVSKFGTVSSNPIPPGVATYQLETITGNIDLSKTE
ncbi:hypothetical protein SAMN05421797_101216 [Maribacter ulvicola]|uniref:Adhesin domain-containing protein n=2 Tax=Maribacter ulvicola TaxID=228959 RepID=A0A1N6P0S7_9FLAO|nr:hypothetical protein SAMN05421797_101216 [Maribacter ulvicola]